MTQKQQVLAELAVRPGTPADIARRLGRPSSSIRRVLGELRDTGQAIQLDKNTYGPTAAAPPEKESASAVLDKVRQFFQAETDLELPDLAQMGTDELRAELETFLARGRRQPLSSVVAAVASHYHHGESEGQHTVEIARAIGTDRSSARRALVTLADRGELRQVKRGVFAPTGDTSSPTTEHFEEAETWVRTIAQRLGFDEVRIFVDRTGRVVEDGIEVIVWNSPHGGGSSTSPPETAPDATPPTRRDPNTPVSPAAAPARAGRADGRAVALSPDPDLGKKIAVLATPYSLLEVIDADGAGDATEMPPGTIGYQETPHGMHYYRLRGAKWQPSEQQDIAFRKASKARGRWHERLFNNDGSSRPPPVVLPHHDDGSPLTPHELRMMQEHKAAYIDAQAKCVSLGLNNGVDLEKTTT